MVISDLSLTNRFSNFLFSCSAIDQPPSTTTHHYSHPPLTYNPSNPTIPHVRLRTCYLLTFFLPHLKMMINRDTSIHPLSHTYIYMPLTLCRSFHLFVRADPVLGYSYRELVDTLVGFGNLAFGLILLCKLYDRRVVYRHPNLVRACHMLSI